ncbi:MAG TPA: hypothetical protein VF994_00105 [Myxococcales bacterium]
MSVKLPEIEPGDETRSCPCHASVAVHKEEMRQRILTDHADAEARASLRRAVRDSLHVKLSLLTRPEAAYLLERVGHHAGVSLKNVAGELHDLGLPK